MQGFSTQFAFQNTGGLLLTGRNHGLEMAPPDSPMCCESDTARTGFRSSEHTEKFDAEIPSWQSLPAGDFKMRLTYVLIRTIINSNSY